MGRPGPLPGLCSLVSLCPSSFHVWCPVFRAVWYCRFLWSGLHLTLTLTKRPDKHQALYSVLLFPGIYLLWRVVVYNMALSLQHIHPTNTKDPTFHSEAWQLVNKRKGTFSIMPPPQTWARIIEALWGREQETGSSLIVYQE